MREVNRSVLVEFTPGQMFSLVDAVEDYPGFLPWCGGTTLHHRDPEITRATIKINYHGLRQSFTTENVKRAPREMLIKLVEGPFRSLDGSWRFGDLGGRGCKALIYESKAQIYHFDRFDLFAIFRYLRIRQQAAVNNPWEQGHSRSQGLVSISCPGRA